MLKKYYEQSGFVGVLDTRAYYIPFKAGEDAFADRKQSGRLTASGRLRITKAFLT